VHHEFTKLPNPNVFSEAPGEDGWEKCAVHFAPKMCLCIVSLASHSFIKVQYIKDHTQERRVTWAESNILMGHRPISRAQIGDITLIWKKVILFAKKNKDLFAPAETKHPLKNALQLF
jgi:hypothetical protein